MTKTRLLLGLLASLCVLMMAACDGVIGFEDDTSRCGSPDFRAALTGHIDEVQVWAGNQAGFAPELLLTSKDEKKIASIMKFFLDRSDQWYVAAGETYDPASRRSGSLFTIRFMSSGREHAYVGWGYTYLETPGCGFEVVRPLAAPDEARLMHLVFDVPLRP